MYTNSDSGFVLYTDYLKVPDLISEAPEFKGSDGSGSRLTFTDPDATGFQLVNPEHS